MELYMRDGGFKRMRKQDPSFIAAAEVGVPPDGPVQRLMAGIPCLVLSLRRE